MAVGPMRKQVFERFGAVTDDRKAVLHAVFVQGALRERKEQLLSAAYLADARNDAKVVNYLARQVVGSQASKPAIAPSAPSSGS